MDGFNSARRNRSATKNGLLHRFDAFLVPMHQAITAFRMRRITVCAVNVARSKKQCRHLGSETMGEARVHK